MQTSPKASVKNILYFCKAVPNASVYIIVFQICVKNCIPYLTFIKTSLRKTHSLNYKELDKFQADKFLISGYLMAKN